MIVEHRPPDPSNASKPPELQDASDGSARISSEALLKGGRVLIIVHGETEYRLRLTAQDKLILTK